MPDSATWIPQLTEDGSFTFFSSEFGESFHSRSGAKQEAFLKYATATNLAQLAQQGHLRLLDVCYGLGYNTAAAIDVIWTMNPHCDIQLYALELDETVPQAAIAPLLLQEWAPPVQVILQDLAQKHACNQSHINATLLLGDARQTIQQLGQIGFSADAIFFDPFSPRRCPQLWTVEFFTQVSRCLTPTGKLATYSRAAAVRSAILAAGLHIGTIPLGDTHLAHEWSQGTVGSFSATSLHPLSPMEQEHLQTRAAVPYRDPSLTDTATTILERHAQEQKNCRLESTSSWRRRWGIT